MPAERAGKTIASVPRPESAESNADLAKAAEDLPLIFIGHLESKYQCALCTKFLKNPLQFEECGHRCCLTCLPELLRTTARCPLDQAKVTKNNTFADKTIIKEMEKLPIKCCNHAAGCKWKGVVKELPAHNDECPFCVISCQRKCGATFERRQLVKHQKETCLKRDTICEYCREVVPADEMMPHLNVCSRYPVYCPNECTTQHMPREQLDVHLEIKCTQRDVPCPFTECGCEYRSPRKDMAKHIKEQPIKHLTMLGIAAGTSKKKIEAHSVTLDKHRDLIDKSTRSVTSFEKLYGAQMIWKIDGYAQKFEEAKTGKKPIIYSPPFLTHRNGYRLMLSACLNGDGKVKDRSMSLYICVCKGDFDALLFWPFNHRVTFTLIDQCQDPEARKNVTYSVKPNTSKENKQFLGRPAGDKNASFGAQKFCDLIMLKTLDYIREDTMFIKVVVDVDDMTVV